MKIVWTFSKFILLCLMLCDSSFSNVEDNLMHMDNVTSTNVLSRRKRFLIFPEGSSFQLVFCNQVAALIPIGDIFLYSSTLALAWTLPTEPKYIYMFKDRANSALRRNDDDSHLERHIYYLDEMGKVIGKVPYKRKPFISPVFAKRSVNEKLEKEINRQHMHRRQMNREYLRMHMDSSVVDFHRQSRVGLYEKLERLFDALGNNGRNCILYKLCESAQKSNKQGTFMQELMRIIFTLPKGKEFENGSHKAYDEAHVETNDCILKYPGCENLVTI